MACLAALHRNGSHHHLVIFCEAILATIPHPFYQVLPLPRVVFALAIGTCLGRYVFGVYLPMHPLLYALFVATFNFVSIFVVTEQIVRFLDLLGRFMCIGQRFLPTPSSPYPTLSLWRCCQVGLSGFSLPHIAFAVT